MVNQQLLNYIRQQMHLRKTKEEIKQELLRVGWQIGDIEESLDIAFPPQSSDSSVASSPVQKEILTPLSLPSVGDLLKRTFSVYRARMGTLVGIAALPLIVGLLISVTQGFILNLTSVLLFIILRLAFMFINLWSQISLIFAIRDRKEKIGIVESFKRGWHKIIPFVLVSFLVSFITLGGAMLFIIPGIIFSIWFIFSTYVLISEDLRGMNAIFRSKQLVDGYWWKILWRFLVLGVVIFAIFIPVILAFFVLAIGSGIIFGGLALLAFSTLSLIITLLISLFISPLPAIFIFLLYEDMKRQKAQVAFEPPKKGTKIKFALIGMLGFLLILLLILIPAISALIVFLL